MQKIELKEYTKFRFEEITKLYKEVGWYKYVNKPVMLKNAFENSLYTQAVYVDDELAGIVRVVGDGHSVIYIQDILVSPHHQKLGLGTKMLVSVINKFENVMQVVLITDKNDKITRYYQSIGFESIEKLPLNAFLIFE